MIRERVSTTGVIRPLEPEDELQAMKVPQEIIGQMSSMTMERYLKDRDRFDKKFRRAIKSIEKHRKKNLQRAKEDTIKRLGLLQQILHRDASEGHPKKLKEKVLNGGSSPNSGWAWALDEHEAPPPSSIASRRDTDEAQALAQIADQAILGDEKMWNANTLWGLVMSFLTVTPGKDTHVLRREGHEHSEHAVLADVNGEGSSSSSKVDDKTSVDGDSTVKGKTTSRFSRIFHRDYYRQHASKSSVSVNTDASIKRKTSSHHHLPLPYCLKDGSHDVDNHSQIITSSSVGGPPAPGPETPKDEPQP